MDRRNRCRPTFFFALAGAVTVTFQSAGAQTSQPASPPTSQPMSIDYYVPSRALGSRPGPEPPPYVRTLSRTGIPALKDLHWLDLGVDHRTRLEYRDDDYRRETFGRDEPFLMRSRAYVGLHDLLDPFLIAAEFQDARIFNGRFPSENGDVDENEIIQLLGELYFKDALGRDRPLRLQAGRMTLDYLDRRLVCRNNWRNATNSFDGFRTIFGQLTNDWQLDLFAVEPVERRLRQPDRTDEEELFYGLIGHWRRWSRFVTIEPYYFIRDQDRKDSTRPDRENHTLGLRGYGVVGASGWDYDCDGAWQFGDDGDLKQRAFAMLGELGYTFEHAWKPRLSASCGFASGDRVFDDHIGERFDRLHGVGRPWSSEDYFIYENVIAPKLRIEAQPIKPIRFDAGYGAYWLASDSDSWSVAGRRDTFGMSGDFIGQELDCRVRWQVDPRVEIALGYSHFLPGPFTENTGLADDSDFFYIETSLRPFQ